jgi:leucine dehydrogenase
MTSQTQKKLDTEFDLFKELSNNDHEKIVLCNDNETGLKAIIAVHNTVLGPGLGGTRMWHYATESEAITDVIRLSRGMTFKASISGLNLGGAKAVIIGDAKKHKSEALMRKFGRFVENMNGGYITAEDVGTTTEDMEYVKMETDFVVGLPESRGGGGDPSPVTAYGVYMGMKASAKKAFGNDSLNGKKISIQGVGKVGMYLVELVSKEGAKVFVSDINEDYLRQANEMYKAEIVSLQDIYSLPVDIYAPCALGATLNSENINQLKCQIVAGAANNQLADEHIHGNQLLEKGIIYAPDFLINAGGLINVYSEWNGYNRENAMRDTEKIYQTTLDIFELAAEKNVHIQEAATILAKKRIDTIMKMKSTY